MSKEAKAGLRLRRPDRDQFSWHEGSLDGLLDPDHRARLVWRFVCGQDLSMLLARVKAVEAGPGAPATDPAVLLALWLYAILDNVGSARRLARLCEDGLAYRWLLGGLTINHHTLGDFRAGGGAFLDELFTRMIAALVAAGIVKAEEITQDGSKIKACAGGGTFRGKEALNALLVEARAHVARVSAGADEPADARAAARERAAREQESRVLAALEAIGEIEARAAAHQTRPGSVPRAKPRASTSDPEARRMKMGDGGWRGAYNAQFGVDAASRAIVGVQVINQGNDLGRLTPLREDVERRTGVKVRTQIADAGYRDKRDIEASEEGGTACVVPLAKGKDGTPCTRGKGDGPGVKAWRERMGTPAAAALLRRRSGLAETPHAELKTYRGLGALTVRGTLNATTMVLLGAIAYNLLHFAQHLT